MIDNNKFCSVCGKEKQIQLIPYINKTIFIDCECETLLKEKEEREKREKAVECYINLRTKSSHLLKREQSAYFDMMTVDNNNKKAISGARHISKLLIHPNTDETKNGLVLYGNRGSGKTFIAAAIINEYNKKHPLNESAVNQIIKERENGYIGSFDLTVNSDCKFIKENDLLSLWGRYDYKTDTSPVDEFKKAKKLLVIDDVGVSCLEKAKIKSAFLNIIDYRHSQQLSTVITTNLSTEELCRYLGERTYDRLQASCYFVGLTSQVSRRH